MRARLLIGCWLVVALRLVAQTAALPLPADTALTKQLLIGEWRFVHVLGPDGQPVDHIDRSSGPDGQTTRVTATGPDMTLRADGSYEKRFTAEHTDAGYWHLSAPDAIVYTLVVPMNSRQGELLKMSMALFNRTWPTDGRGNYLDTSTEHVVRLSASEMHVLEHGNTFVYRKR